MKYHLGRCVTSCHDHGLGCTDGLVMGDPNTKSAFAQNQQPQQSKRWARASQGTGAEQAQSPPLPLCLGTAPVAMGRGSLQPQGGDLVQQKQEHNAIY